MPASSAETVPPPRRRRPGAVVPLLIFAVLYLGVLAVAANALWAAGCAAMAGMVAVISWRLGAAPRRMPTGLQLRAVSLTSALEGVALIIAVAVGALSGVWWPVLPIVLTAVAVHFCALDVAFRRAVDHWASGCLMVAATVAWIFSRTALPWIWPLTAAIAAGACLGYAIALAAVRADQRRAADSDVPPPLEDALTVHQRGE